MKINLKKLFGSIAALAIGVTLVGCGETQETPKHEHTFADTLTSDETGHWYQATCEHTTEKKDFAEHTFVDTTDKDEAATTTSEGKDYKKCDCGYETYTVVPMLPAVEITTTTNNLFVTKQLQLEATSNQDNPTIVWSVDNAEVATISATGLLEALQPGKVVVTAKLSDNETVLDTFEVTISNTLLNLGTNPDHWDYSGLFNTTNVSFATIESAQNNVNTYATFNNVTGTTYMYSAHVSLNNPKGDDTWSRVSLGYIDANNAFHGFFISPGVNYTQPKGVYMDVVDGGVLWGAVTDRSQIWGQHDLNKLDMTSFELTTIRKGTTVYYLVNGELFWLETISADAVLTPAIMAAQVEADFSEVELTLNEALVDVEIEKVKNDKFYASYSDNVVISEDGKTIEFKNANNQNPKDHAAKSIGEGALLPAGKTSTVTFDLTIKSFGANNAMPALAVTINRYDANCAEARSVIIAQGKAGFTGWNSNGSLNEGIGSGGVEYNNGDWLLENVTYKVTFTRLMTGNGQDTSYKITDAAGNVITEAKHGWEDGYSGNVVLSFLCRDLDCVVSNINITVAE